ncbi:P-loop NTPase fold protein (plasmid) [Pseudoalteromonas sp. T1lg65]|uniref:P-loop NTPase fold protein n=1 Tax=Pseudoalteromonas sp. T1lg65 TaxID=2077101 RepID=UPI003F797ADD
MLDSKLIKVLGAQIIKRKNSSTPILVGLSGAQGSGKSTLSRALCHHLNQSGLYAESVSLDDFYLSPKKRTQMAQQLHPLFKQRGVPGTHDISLIEQTFKSFRARKLATLPVFDKATDSPLKKALWRKCINSPDVLIFEGWCVGVPPQLEPSKPINDFEREKDPDARFKGLVNQFLANEYQRVFAQLDLLIFLNGICFSRVLNWRLEQEHELIKNVGQGMSDSQIAQFIQPFQNLTEWSIQVLPNIADIEVRLDQNRQVTAVHTRKI